MDRLTTKIKTVNGETTNVVIVSSETLTPSVDKVVKVGTKIVIEGLADVIELKHGCPPLRAGA